MPQEDKETSSFQKEWDRMVEDEFLSEIIRKSMVAAMKEDHKKPETLPEKKE